MTYGERIEALQQKMIKADIDGWLATQNVDLYYLTGTMQTGYLFVPQQGTPVLYVRRSVVRAREESGVEVEPIGSFRSWGERLKARFPQTFRNGVPKQAVVATEYDVLPVQQFYRLQQVVTGVEWRDGSAMIRELRMIKSAAELASIREAARLVDAAFGHAIRLIKPGMAEFELMAEIEYYLRKNGHLGIMRMRGYNQEIVTGMVGGGAAAAMPTYFDGPAGGQGLSPASPQSAGRNTFAPGEPILLDLGCCVDGYVIDQTRTAVIGSLADDLAHAYDVSEAILRDAERQLLPGTVSERLYAEALDRARTEGLANHFMGYGDDQVKFLGHGIGLEIDELPVLAKGFDYPLEPGMVIAVEPKFTFPGRGVVGIENSYAITADGFEKLTVSKEGVIRL